MKKLYGNQENNLLEGDKQSLIKYKKSGDNETFIDYNENGDIVKERIHCNGAFIREKNYTYTYDSNGNKITESSKEHSYTGKVSDSSEIIWNSEGNKVNEFFERYDSRGIVDYSYENKWTYNSNGNNVSKSHQRYDANYYYDYNWTYDINGNKLAETYEETNGNIKDSSKSTWSYDANGNLLKKIYINHKDDGTINYSAETNWTYNSSNHKITELHKRYNSSGDARQFFEKNWSYDSNGNKLSRFYKVYDYVGNLNYTDEYNWTYDTNGKMLKESYRQYIRSSLSLKWDHVYEPYNNKSSILRTWYIAGSKGSSRRDYTYDSDGNILTDSYKQYNSDGVVFEKLDKSYSYTPIIYDLMDGKEGNDTLIGTGTDETLIGGQGNDLLQGGLGNDSYLYKLSHGYDVIEESGGFDKLVFGENIAKQDIEFAKQDNDLLISINNDKGQITVSDWYVNDKHKVEAMDFGGSSLNLLQIEALACVDNLVAGDYFKDTSIDTNAIEYIKSRIADYDGSDFGECVAKLKSLNEQQKDNLVNSMKKAVKEGVFSEIEPMLENGQLQSVIADMSAYGAEAGIGLNDVKEYVDDTEMMNMIMPYLS